MNPKGSPGRWKSQNFPVDDVQPGNSLAAEIALTRSPLQKMHRCTMEFV